MPLRPAVSRAAKPGMGETAAEREPIRLTSEHRRGAELPSISLNASDRLIISSGSAAFGRKKERSLLRVFVLTVLLVLAAFGAYSLYHGASAFLP
ncbi:MAG: hypothetical protein ACLQJR_18420 [Stellaceae bacterium]